MDVALREGQFDGIITKLSLRAAGVLSFALPASIMAQQPASIVAGMRVEGLAGGLIGTVTSIDGESVTVKTDRHSVQIAKTAFAPDKGMLKLGMTQGQLDDAVDRSLADAAAKLVVGASVVGSQGAQGAQGAQGGTIATIDGQFATLRLTSGKMIKIPRNGLAVGADGPAIAMTASAFDPDAALATPVKPWAIVGLLYLPAQIGRGSRPRLAFILSFQSMRISGQLTGYAVTNPTSICVLDRTRTPRC